MRFSFSGLLKGLIPTLLAGLIIVALLRSMGYIGGGESADSPSSLVKQATENLEAVRKRQPGDRRPASYDSVMAPLDELLRQTKKLLESDTYNPVADFEKVRALTLPVIDIATQADRQARSETGYLVKEYRFNSQKGEASQYLANALWERINRQLPKQTGFLNESTPYPPAEMNELRRILDTGLEAAPLNRDLWYIRGVVNRAEGLFAPAARDLERAVDIDNEYVAAWNTLGLVRISLREFDKAEDALERARIVSEDLAQKFKIEPGVEYVSILYNLASFHEGLATYYSRENRIHPTVESQRLYTRHAADARRYFQEFLDREPPGTPDARAAQAKLQSLPR